MNMTAPSPVKCSLSWIPTSGLASTFSRRALRTTKGVPPLVATVQLEQVKGVEDHLVVVGAALELVEDREPGVVAIDRLPLEDH